MSQHQQSNQRDKECENMTFQNILQGSKEIYRDSNLTTDEKKKAEREAMERAWDEWLRVVPSDEPRTRSAFEAGWRAAYKGEGARLIINAGEGNQPREEIALSDEQTKRVREIMAAASPVADEGERTAWDVLFLSNRAPVCPTCGGPVSDAKVEADVEGIELEVTAALAEVRVGHIPSQAGLERLAEKVAILAARAVSGEDKER